MMARIAAFTKYGREAASTRQRVLQYIPYLERAGFTVEVHALLDDDYVRALARGQRIDRRSIAAAYWRRLGQLRAARNADLLWIYAELFPYLPAPFERLAARIERPFVYDMDDAFFHPYDGNPNPVARRLLSGKLTPLIAGAAAVCCGNDYLRSYAARYSDRTILLPTVVDINDYVPGERTMGRPLTIGWIGSPTTFPFLQPLLPLLDRLAEKHALRILIVGAGPSAAKHATPRIALEPWTEMSEVASVQAMDIGIMPLPNDPWTQGKSGYKLIQYMACGLPVVASPVGVNPTIVQDGLTGFLANELPRWHEALQQLVENPSLRLAMGRAGRVRAVDCYSVHTYAPQVVQIMQAAARQATR